MTNFLDEVKNNLLIVVFKTLYNQFTHKVDWMTSLIESGICLAKRGRKCRSYGQNLWNLPLIEKKETEKGKKETEFATFWQCKGKGGMAFDGGCIMSLNFTFGAAYSKLFFVPT